MKKLTLTLRLDEKMRDYLKTRADFSNRSMNGEILEIFKNLQKKEPLETLDNTEK